MDDDFLFRKGYLQVKRGLISFKRHVTLTAPLNIGQVQQVFESCFIMDPFAPIPNKAIPWLGNICFAALKNMPLLIISANESYEDPVFIPLDSTMKLKEEQDIEKPCCFEIIVGNNSLQFSSLMSTDYQQWISCLHVALERAQQSQTTISSELWTQNLPNDSNSLVSHS